MRERILFVDGWRFHDGEIEVAPPAVKGPVYTQAKTESYRFGPAAIHYDDRPDDFGAPLRMLTHERWENVTLPHDYIVNSPITKEGNEALGFYNYRPAWYRKHFTAEESWRGGRVEVEFLGVATECEVYLNGSLLYRNDTQYTPFTVDITDFLRYGGVDNVLAVHVKPGRIEGWWYAGAGICHKVYLSVTSAVAVVRDSLFVAPKKLESGLWEVPFELEVYNDSYEDKSVSVAIGIAEPDGTKRAWSLRSGVVCARDTLKITGAVPQNRYTEWDIDAPYLYTAIARVSVDGAECDEYTTKFGFRTIEFDAERGFILNGRRRYINGVCGHEDFALTGKAVPDNVMRHKVRMLKEMGVNAYRAAHSMQDEALMDAFDEMGIMVMAETRHFSTSKVHIEELRTLVRRDRNRPSVFMWSVGNEEHYFITDEGRRIAEAMTYEVKRLDGTRPVMTANDKKPEECTVYEISDLVGVNYNHWLYDYLHDKFPNKPIFASECAAAVSTRGWYLPFSEGHGYAPAYDEDLNYWFINHENTYKILRDRPWMMGAFIWSAFDYLGEAKWPRITSASGAIDAYFQKKDAYYQLRSYFTDEPMVHLMPHWNEQRSGDAVRVVAYTNCESVELFLNGRSLGVLSVPRYEHAEWCVSYEPGEIRAVAYGKDGEVLAEDVRVTTGKPASLRLILENGEDLCANGEDLALFTCCAVDEFGREVPDAECEVTFMSDDGVRIVGTGSDNTDHTPPASPRRRMMAGRILVALLPYKAGKCTLHAWAAGLKSAHLTVDIPEDTMALKGRVYPEIKRNV